MKFFSKIVVFLVKKGSYTTFNTVKKHKIRKTWSMTKKRLSEIFGVKIEIFSGKNVSQKSWSAKKNSVPPNSASGLCHCIYYFLPPFAPQYFGLPTQYF